ncbi:hypothetical protein QW180_22340 [Vibrio sinaloensis]|nr:hypothetical protein [Vibrio sinaloensis]
MSNMKQSALDLQSIVDALSKVERANKVDLCPLKTIDYQHTRRYIRNIQSSWINRFDRFSLQDLK